MGIWRLSRNRYARALYDALHERGITATMMTEYRRSLPNRRSPPASRAVQVDRCAPADVVSVGAPVGELEPDEVVVGAFVGRRAVGYLFCSVETTHTIAPLERDLTFDGGYIRRVFVVPAERGRGVAASLVDRACRWAATNGARKATALVARDNVPSRKLFEGRGFTPVRSRFYARLGPLSVRRQRER